MEFSVSGSAAWWRYFYCSVYYSGSLRDILGTDGDMVAEEVEQNCEYLNLLCHMHCLTGREQKVVAMRYGLDGTDALTQKEVGERLGVSRSYVSRIEKKALEKLMKAIKLRE